MSMTYVAPDPHRCILPRRTSYPPDSVWRCPDCGGWWVVRQTKDYPPSRVWKPLRWWHFNARRVLRDLREGGIR